MLRKHRRRRRPEFSDSRVPAVCIRNLSDSLTYTWISWGCASCPCCCQFLWITIRSNNQAWNYSETSAQFLVLKHNSRAQHKTPSSTNIKVDIKGKLGNIYHSFVTNLILWEVARDILFLTSPYLSKSGSLSHRLVKPDRISTFFNIQSINALMLGPNLPNKWQIGP